MKNRKNTPAKLALTIALCITLFNTVAQNSARLALGLESFSSGNTHGTFFRPYTGYEWSGNLITIGPMIHKRSSMIKGVKAEYSRNLSSSLDRYSINSQGHYVYDLLQINFISHLQYNAPLSMSRYVVTEQNCVSQTNDVDWEKVQLATLEAGIGFEVRVNLTKNITWRNSSSAALHYHTLYAKGLSRDRMAPSLALSTGLLFVLD